MLHPAARTPPSPWKCAACILEAAASTARRATSATRLRARSYATASPSTSSSPSSSSSAAAANKDAVCNLQTFNTKQGKVRVDLTRPGLVGKAQSRGERPYQEDTYAVHGVCLPSVETLASLSESSSSSASGARGTSDPVILLDEIDDDHLQALYVSVFDGHNGGSVSNHLREKLHSSILGLKREAVNDVVDEYRDLGGYLRRYRGGILQPLLVDERPGRRASSAATTESRKEGSSQSQEADAAREKRRKEKDAIPWSFHQRVHAAFLQTDLECIRIDQEAGAVATVAFVHSLDSPQAPFFSSNHIHILVAHLGDTRALLCSVPDGTAIPLTETHHPEARSETDRLMRTRTGAVTDSFGESRWAGTLANTRGFGDAHYKALGVFAEPAITSKIVAGADTAFVMLMSDGITEKMSDQEIVDLARAQRDPQIAAREVVSFAESIGAQDNLTCIVVPLPGWGRATGEDTTKARRDFRAKNFEGRSNRQNRM